MSEDPVQRKIELYQAAFKNLYDQAIEDIGKTAGAGGQASQEQIEELWNTVHRQLFGHGHDKDGKEVP